MLFLLGCDARAPLVDQQRELAQVELAGRSYRWGATHHGWHHGWSLDPTDPHSPYDAVYVGWEVTSEPRPVKGAVDQTWELDSVQQGEQRFHALALEHCEGDHLLAFRVLPDEPWRVLVADEAGAAGGLAEGDACAMALQWAGTADTWRRDHAADLEVCAHLYRSRRLDEAVRCLLREPEREGDRASRHDLPRAPDQATFDRALLWALSPEADGDRSAFSPSRVRDLLSEA